MAALRTISVVQGYKGPHTFRQRIFTRRPEQVSPLAGRLFAVWTLVTCFCCLVASQNLDNRPVFLITIFSFLVALFFFALETLWYGTLNLNAVNSIPFFVASISVAWMLLELPAAKL